MERMVTAKQMKAEDAYTMNQIGIPSLVLMERAALCTVEEICSGNHCTDRILVVCGTGNNGGDGMAIGRILYERGYHVEICCIGKREKYSEEMEIQDKIAENYGVPLVKNPFFGEYTVIIDAIFGIGLSRPLTGIFADTVERINKSGVPVIAVDIPSGIHTDTGEVLGTGVRAVSTVTFAHAKPGLFLYPGKEYAGRVQVREIGIRALPGGEDELVYRMADKKDLEWITLRDPRGNKGTFGKVLVIAGSDEMCGAAVLCARAVLGSGAGMVKVFTEQSNRIPILAAFPEVMISTWQMDRPIPEEKLLRDMKWCDAIVIGPGIGMSQKAKEILKLTLQMAQQPLILDADALNLISADPSVLDSCTALRIITPHVGELSRLSGWEISRIKQNPVKAALFAADRYGAICVLKDSVTVTAGREDKQETVYINHSGSHALATAGSGDVLCGIIGAFTARMVCDRREGFLFASALAVYFHGLSGEKAAESMGAASVTASDVIDAFGRVLSDG
ncbi:MAG: NAD(P)H-hydrate dehydratase [Fusicatenibacter sp.]|nr:NAD(P)H-hydrate dehydratase [Fusicatenibacter sp.]